MTRTGAVVAFLFVCAGLAACGGDNEAKPPPSLQVGVSAIRLTPCGDNDDYGGPITPSGVWGEEFTDTNGDGRYNEGEPFVDDPVNSQLDPGSEGKYDGIYLAGFGNDRIATSCHDDLWARVLVLQGPTKKVAMVSVDFVGIVANGSYFGFARAAEQVDPSLGLDGIVFSSTHSHEGPDTLGLWGTSIASDGKFPRYLQFVDRQIARAINAAAAPGALKPVRVVAAHTNSTDTPQLRGLQVRTGCRPPFFFDDELRALQFVGTDDATVATLINWNTHPESLEDENTDVSSDFIHYIRQRVEADLGGTAVYFTGDLGAVEIVGDTCVGGAGPLGEGTTNPFDMRDNLGHERTGRLGDLVGGVTVDILRRGESLSVSEVDIAETRYYVAGTNLAFQLGQTLGIFDVDLGAFDLANCPPGTVFCAPVDQQLVTLKDSGGAPLVQIMTASGELFPELFYGTAEHHRTDCPQAATGLPYEPSIRNAMRAPYRFLIGLSPNEYGYIVPGYDFYDPPEVLTEANDPCEGQQFDPAIPRRRVPNHYHETLAIGVDMAATATCHALRLLGEDDVANENAACQRVFGD